MKAVPWSRCCSNSTLMSFNTPWAWRRGASVEVCFVWVCIFVSMCAHSCINLYVSLCACVWIPESRRSRSAAFCEWCCCRPVLRSQPVRGGGRSRWGRPPCWGPQRWSHNAGDTVCPLTPKRGQRHQFLLVETQSGRPEEWAGLKEGLMMV